MTKQEYLVFHKNACEKMIQITRAKNHDYTGAGDDPFSNFKSVEINGVCSTEQGFLVRMSDKLSRVISFVQQGTLKVKDESVIDTLLDLANYCILMAAYIESKRNKPKSTIDSTKLTQEEKAQLNVYGELINRNNENYSGNY